MGSGAGKPSSRMRHVLSALVQNQPGVLAHVSGMFASRGFNIESLAVGETEDAHLSRITVVVNGDDRMLEQIRKQMEKIVTVVKVLDISRADFVERDLMLIKIAARPEIRAELQGLVQIFRARIVDVSPDQIMVEISGQEKKIEAFIDAVRPYGIRELARTGRIALVRGDADVEDDDSIDLPTPDATGSISMGSTGGTVALVHGTAPLTCTTATACAGDSSVVDLVGWGSAAIREGSDDPATTNTTSVQRTGASDTDDNGADFTAAAPTPQNSSAGGTGSTSIHTVQGTSWVSPLKGQTVSGVAGIVTTVIKTGFWFQDPTPDDNPGPRFG